MQVSVVFVGWGMGVGVQRERRGAAARGVLLAHRGYRQEPAAHECEGSGRLNPQDTCDVVLTHMSLSLSFFVLCCAGGAG
jgi:hypothetical protein